ncbi:hypothetical protein NCCP2716_17060 [Sporosarcina sp. NCCP-2716]|nr:hypothetical protein NCCP2716_17060 [Sporosarcina sp. NCCP-2716]
MERLAGGMERFGSEIDRLARSIERLLAPGLFIPPENPPVWITGGPEDSVTTARA